MEAGRRRARSACPSARAEGGTAAGRISAARRAAQRAAPSRAVSSFMITRTGIVREQRSEPALGREGLHERRALSLLDDPRRDAPAQVHAAGGHQLEGEVGRLAAVRRDEEVEGLRAELALAVEGGARDDGGAVAGADRRGEPLGLGAAPRVSQERVDVQRGPAPTARAPSSRGRRTCRGGSAAGRARGRSAARSPRDRPRRRTDGAARRPSTCRPPRAPCPRRSPRCSRAAPAAPALSTTRSWSSSVKMPWALASRSLMSPTCG